MEFDDVASFLPYHNMVSSEWEKNQLIRDAHAHARIEMLPRLIEVIEKHWGSGVWLSSIDIFPSNFPSSEIWNNPDYYTVHSKNDASFSTKEQDSTPTSRCFDGTVTEFFFSRCHKSSTGKRKIRNKKFLPDKCLLRHELSVGCCRFLVCKLRRRHLKEISKLPSFSSSSSSSSSQIPLSSTILDELAISTVLKIHIQTKSNNEKIQNDFIQSAVTMESNCNLTKKEEQENVNYDNGALLWNELNPTISRALYIIHAANNLEVGLVPRTARVRWKEENDFEVRYYTV